MTSKRKLSRNGCQHVFQISLDHGIIFYTDDDYIVFFTILSCVAVKYRIRIVSLCIMKNHFHMLAFINSAEKMELFVNALCSVFARLYNKRYHRKGKLFKKSYGSAPKYSGTDIIDCIIYIQNNPVPKRAVDHAVDYRWNFLAYMDSRHPFSSPVDHSKCSNELRMKLSMVERMHSTGRHIGYNDFDSLKEGLNNETYLQLLDHIVSVYNVIDYRLQLSQWKTKDEISRVLDLIKGSEYDLKEDTSREDYRNYDKMNEIVRSAGFNLSRIRFDSEDVDPRQIDRLRKKVIYQINPASVELEKYFHTRRSAPKTP